ncbi:ABC transporter substrate-binding protein [Nocardiopsis salina]|uniref:ABC transporter substrate-binding protein n=1 Tax=Nocardiopsis salina TaxID=245836 RepID=UPI00037D75ED|nr:ABC transporter substrate-binding protein [Nocardiopsis salina]
MPACAAALTLVLVPGCGFFTLGPAGAGGEQSTVEASGEAPALAELVESGELEAVEERLPEDPVVVEPVERIGRYGGEWNSATLGVNDWPWLGRTVGYEELTRWDPEFEEAIPNLAEDWEYNDDATELTFTLRAGLKWSDGEPFTSDDVVFAINDVLDHDDLAPGVEPISAEKTDDLTFTIFFSEPDALWAGHSLLQYQVVTKPKHYLERFHEDHNPDADALAEQEGYGSWVDLFEREAGVSNSARYWQNPDIPTMAPWKTTEALSDAGRMVLDRNPYYWKVDSEGNQLPYLDRVVFDILQDEEMMLTRALNGDINMHARHFNTLHNRPTVGHAREPGGFEFFELETSEMNTNAIAFNLTHEDEELREIFNDKDFRIAMSHAINRQDIVDVVYQEQGEPWQLAPREDSPFYNETLAEQYTEYDVDLANRILDEAGYEERDGQGVRMSPDGARVSFTLSVPTGFRPDIVDSMEMVVDQWAALDIDVDLQAEDRDLWVERNQNNEHDANVFSGDNGTQDLLYDPRWYAPTQGGESNFAIPWAQWYVSRGNDDRGQEPPEDVREQLAIYDEVKAEPDPERQEELMHDLLEISQEQFYAIGVSLPPPSYGIVADDFHNVPGSMPSSSIYNDPGPSNPEQYFIE